MTRGDRLTPCLLLFLSPTLTFKFVFTHEGNPLVNQTNEIMNTPIVDPYPDSQYPEISPILLAVFQDIQGRQVNLPGFSPMMTKLPPDNPGDAYALSIYDRLAHMSIHRFSPGNGDVELYFGTGGRQFGPFRLEGVMVVPSQYTGLISLMTVVWITLQLNRLDLIGWSLARIKAYYPDIVNNEAYTNVLRTFCHNVLSMAEDSFTSSTNQVGFATDYDDQ